MRALGSVQWKSCRAISGKAREWVIGGANQRTVRFMTSPGPRICMGHFIDNVTERMQDRNALKGKAVLRIYHVFVFVFVPKVYVSRKEFMRIVASENASGMHWELWLNLIFPKRYVLYLVKKCVSWKLKTPVALGICLYLKFPSAMYLVVIVKK